MNKVVLFAALVTPLVSASGPARTPADCALDCPAPSAAQGDVALQTYAQAVAQISAQAVFAPADRASIVGQTLADYLAAQDSYSGFLTREEYAAYKAVRDGPYAGVGADLERRRDGNTYCYPFAKGAAARAGIKPGEQLLSIDGQPVKGKPLALLAALATGRAGTRVALEVVDAGGLARRVSIVREHVDERSVSEYTVGASRVLKLTRFTSTAPADFQQALSHWDRTMPIIIDLRDCGGGDFYAALDTAMLFLDKGMPIVSVIRRDGVTAYASTSAGLELAQPVFLWQSEHTASAAELFIGALTDNSRATSVGRVSAGKGSRQDIVALSDGAALILTTGYLSTPHGLRFDGRGLDPQRPVADGAGTAVYVQASGSKE